MIIRKVRNERRLGAAAVETALIIIPLFMFVMGTFEFGRLVMVLNVTNNAAREGCRWALANNTDSNIANDIITQVNSRMCGLNTTAFTNYSVTVSGTHIVNGTSTSYSGNGVNNLAAGDMITVTVTGTFKFMNVIPLVTLPSFTITSAPTMVCEGAT